MEIKLFNEEEMNALLTPLHSVDSLSSFQQAITDFMTDIRYTKNQRSNN